MSLYEEYAPEVRPNIAVRPRQRSWVADTQWDKNTFFMTRDELVAHLRKYRHMR